MTRFAQSLSRLIEERGWTQLEAAEKLGVSQGLISRYLRSQREPLPRTIQYLAERLGVSTSELSGKETDHRKVTRAAKFPTSTGAFPDKSCIVAMRNLKKRWKKRPDERDSIRHLIAVLYGDDASKILTWLDSS